MNADLLLDPDTKDLAFRSINGVMDFVLVHDYAGSPDATEQRINVTARSQQGEWDENEAFGLPWIGKILGGNKGQYSAQTSAGLIASGLIVVPRVTEIANIELSVDQNARLLSFRADFGSEYGSVTVEV